MVVIKLFYFLNLKFILNSFNLYEKETIFFELKKVVKLLFLNNKVFFINQY